MISTKGKLFLYISQTGKMSMQELRHREARSYIGMDIVYSVFLPCHGQLVRTLSSRTMSSRISKLLTEKQIYLYITNLFLSKILVVIFVNYA